MFVNVTIFYSILHMLVDGVCAFAMFGVFLPQGQGMFSIILYNFCAFALQMPFGIILDILQIRLEQKACFCREDQFGQADITSENRSLFAIERKKQNLCLQTIAAGIILTILGTMTHPALLGIGNALFHVGGGIGTIYEDTQKDWNGKGLGIFVAPGALGLYLGTIAGKNGIQEYVLWIACGIMAGLVVVIIYLWNSGTNANYFAATYKEANARKNIYQISDTQQSISKGTFYLAVCCVLVVILRSYIGMAVTFPWKTTVLSGFAAVLAVVLGKIAGGILGAIYGFRKISMISLFFAAICYISGAWMPMGIAALLLFNMTMPITLYLLVSKLPQMSGFCFGLLTFALFLGFLPEYFGLRPIVNGNIIGSVGSILSLIALLSCFSKGSK